MQRCGVEMLELNIWKISLMGGPAKREFPYRDWYCISVTNDVLIVFSDAFNFAENDGRSKGRMGVFSERK